jgi:carbamate kinase
MAVVALGGHSLLPKTERPTMTRQFRYTQRAIGYVLARFGSGTDLVLTHGNGPQVGHILLRSELAAAAKEAYLIPLSVAVAQSQGEIGYIIQQTVYNQLRQLRQAGQDRAVVTVLTQVLVDHQDPGFQNPTKPIGPFYSEAQANGLRRRNIPLVQVEGHGWRRVVASPRPLEIIEAETVRRLAQEGAVVIAAGGGGIPVVRQRGRLHGVDAVIDKDLASSCLAKALGAQTLVILTDVRQVSLSYGRTEQQNLSRMSVAEARGWLEQGHFLPGSMGPKVKAAIDFAENTGNPALITTPEALEAALDHRDGTYIVP